MLVSKLWMELTRRAAAGEISEDHLKGFLARPDIVLRHGCSEKLIGLLPKAESEWKPRVMGGKPYVILHPEGAATGHRHFWGDQQFSQGWAQIDSDSCQVVDGKLYFLGRLHDDPRWHLAVDGKIVASYDQITDLSIVGGLPLYRVKHLGEWSIVYGDKRFPAHAGMGTIFLLDGDPLYVAQDGTTERRTFLAHGSRNLTLGSERVYIQSVVHGKPLYTLRQDGREFVVWGRWTSEAYDEVSRPDIIDGKPFFQVWPHRDEHCFIWGDEMIKERLEHCTPCDSFVTLVNGRLLYVATDNWGRQWVMWGSQAYAQRCDIWDVCMAEGQPLYAAMDVEEGKQFVIWGNTVISKQYDDVFDLSYRIDGLVRFYARKGRRMFEVTHRL